MPSWRFYSARFNKILVFWFLPNFRSWDVEKLEYHPIHTSSALNEDIWIKIDLYKTIPNRGLRFCHHLAQNYQNPKMELQVECENRCGPSTDIPLQQVLGAWYAAGPAQHGRSYVLVMPMTFQYLKLRVSLNSGVCCDWIKGFDPEALPSWLCMVGWIINLASPSFRWVVVVFFGEES